MSGKVFCLAIAILGGISAQSLEGQDLYVADKGNDRVGEYDAATGQVINADLVSLTASPTGIAVLGNDLYVEAGTAIGEYNAATGDMIDSNFIRPTDVPSCIVASGGTIYIAQDFDVAAYNASNGQLISSDLVTVTTNPIAALAVSGSDLYVEGGTNGISEYNATTGTPVSVGLVPTPPTGDGAGSQELIVSGSNLYCACVSGTYYGVSVYSATSGDLISQELTFSEYPPPYGMAIDGNDLLTANDTTGISQFDATSGALIDGTFISGLDQPGFIIVAPVPEPGEGTLVAAGACAALAFGVSSRRKSRLRT